MDVIGTLLRGIGAGFLATSVLSLLMLTGQWLPQLDTITVLDRIARDLALAAGLPTPLAGWMWHFIVGCLIWAWMYAVMEPIIPGREPWRKGVYFGLTATLLAWFMVLPLAKAGLFGMRLSMAQPLVTLAQHLIYGVVLAVVYDRITHTKVQPGKRSQDE